MRPTAIGSLTAAAVFVLAVLVTLPAFATILHVPEPYETIAAGIAAASPGDTVWIACGTYTESGLEITTPITLRGDEPSICCVQIDAGGPDRVLTISDASGASIQGIEFMNGVALSGAGVYVDSCDVAFMSCCFTGNAAEIEGGGLYYRYGDPTITGCWFTNNSAADRGGNLAMRGTGGTVVECEFTGGTAEWGGGACVRVDATTHFEYCTFDGNHATGDEGYGGGFYAGTNAMPVVVDCGFIGNSSGLCGGGAALYGCESAIFSASSFTENTAQWGGAVFVADAVSGEVTHGTFAWNEALGGGAVMFDNAGHFGVYSSYFLGNTATTEAGGGVLLVNAAEGGKVSDCIFEANTAVYGGGVALQGGTPGMPVYGCTFALNSITGGRGVGAGIAVDGISVPIAQNIIAFSTSGEAIGCEGGGAVTANACAIYGNAGGDWVGCIAGQESQNHNSDADPLFCDMYVGSLHLCENSYCHSSNNPSGMQIGALPPGCDACESPVEMESWGGIKAMYR